MSHSASLSKRFLLFVYVVVWSVLLAGAAVWLTGYLVGTVGDPLAGKKAQAADFQGFDSIVALTEEKVARYLGDWEFQEPKLPGHFHHISRWYQADKQNFCVDCHGPIPHSRNTRERAFLNMHNLFISCQVCHVREQETVALTRFGWIDLATGQLCANPDMDKGAWGEYGAKIIPLAGTPDDSRPLQLEEEKEFAAQFRQRMNGLSESQRVIGNKFIHRRCVEKPVQCSTCHDAQSAFLPYTALGYSAERAAFLVSAEVVDLVQRYETFHMPKLLNPPAEQDQGPREKQ
jgi:hypothetical protein